MEPSPVSSLKPRRGLSSKIVAIMKDCPEVAKTGYNKAQNYHYIEESELSKVMRPLLVKNGVAIYQDVLDVVITQHLLQVRVRYLLEDVDTGDTKEVHSWGQALLGKGDKSLYAAITGAHKYFLLKTFNLTSDVDPEQDRHEPPAPTYQTQIPVSRSYGSTATAAAAGPVAPATENQTRAIYAILKNQHGLDDQEIDIYVKQQTGVTQKRNLTKSQASKLIEFLKNGGTVSLKPPASSEGTSFDLPPLEDETP